MREASCIMAATHGAGFPSLFDFPPEPDTEHVVPRLKRDGDGGKQTQILLLFKGTFY